MLTGCQELLTSSLTTPFISNLRVKTFRCCDVIPTWTEPSTWEGTILVHLLDSISKWIKEESLLSLVQVLKKPKCNIVHWPFPPHVFYDSILFTRSHGAFSVSFSLQLHSDQQAGQPETMCIISTGTNTKTCTCTVSHARRQTPSTCLSPRPAGAKHTQV